MAPSKYAKHYKSQMEELMQQLLGSLPGLSPGLRDPSSPQYEVGMSFAIGHTMQNSLLDLEPDRVAADAAGVLEKLELSGHGRKARRLAQAFAAILKQEDVDENEEPSRDIAGQKATQKSKLEIMTKPYMAIAMLLGLADAPTRTGSHVDNTFEAHMRSVGSSASSESTPSWAPESTRAAAESAAQAVSEDEEEEAEEIRQMLLDWNGGFEDGADETDEEDWREEDEEDGTKCAIEEGPRILGATEALAELRKHQEAEEQRVRARAVAERRRKLLQKLIAAGEEARSLEAAAGFEQDGDISSLISSSGCLSPDDPAFTTTASPRTTTQPPHPWFEAAAARRRVARHFGQEFMSGGETSFNIRHQFTGRLTTMNSPVRSGAVVEASEAEIIRSVLQALQGHEGRLFRFVKDTEGNGSVPTAGWGVELSSLALRVQCGKLSATGPLTPQPVQALSLPSPSSYSSWSDRGSGLNGHIPSAVLRRLLERFAAHAADLRYLRDFLPGRAQAASVQPNCDGEYTSAFCATHHAWLRCVSDWVIVADRQLSFLERVSYEDGSSMRKQVLDTAQLEWGASRGQVAAASVSTLAQLGLVLGSTQRRARALRTLSQNVLQRAVQSSAATSEELHPKARSTASTGRVAVSSSSSSSDRFMPSRAAEESAQLIRRVASATHVIDSLWDALQCAETLQMPCGVAVSDLCIEEQRSSLSNKSFANDSAAVMNEVEPVSPVNDNGGSAGRVTPQSVSSSSSFRIGAVPHQPPDPRSRKWLLAAFRQCISPLMSTVSIWVLEGRVEDAMGETFLSVLQRITANASRHQLAAHPQEAPTPVVSATVFSSSSSSSSSSSVSSPSGAAVATTTSQAMARGGGGAAVGGPADQIAVYMPQCLVPLAAAIVACGHAVDLMRATQKGNRVWSSSEIGHRRKHRPRVPTNGLEKLEARPFSEGGAWTAKGQWIGTALRAHLEILNARAKNDGKKSVHDALGKDHIDNFGVMSDLGVASLTVLLHRFSPTLAGISGAKLTTGSSLCTIDDLNHDLPTNKSTARILEGQVKEAKEKDPRRALMSDDDKMGTMGSRPVVVVDDWKRPYDSSVIEQTKAGENEHEVLVVKPDSQAVVLEASSSFLGVCDTLLVAPHDGYARRPVHRLFRNDHGRASERTLETLKDDRSPHPETVFVEKTLGDMTGDESAHKGSNGTTQSVPQICDKVSTALWFHRAVVKPLGTHCLAASAAAANTFRDELLIIPALGALRALFLMSDEELYGTFFDRLFNLTPDRKSTGLPASLAVRSGSANTTSRSQISVGTFAASAALEERPYFARFFEAPTILASALPVAVRAERALHKLRQVAAPLGRQRLGCVRPPERLLAPALTELLRASVTEAVANRTAAGGVASYYDNSVEYTSVHSRDEIDEHQESDFDANEDTSIGERVRETRQQRTSAERRCIAVEEAAATAKLGVTDAFLEPHNSLWSTSSGGINSSTIPNDTSREQQPPRLPLCLDDFRLNILPPAGLTEAHTAAMEAFRGRNGVLHNGLLNEKPLPTTPMPELHLPAALFASPSSDPLVVADRAALSGLGLHDEVDHVDGGEELGYDGNNTILDGVRQLSWLQLECHVTWPIDAIATPNALAAYNRAFVLLLQVKYAKTALETVRWRLHKTRRRPGKHSAAPTQIPRNKSPMSPPQWHTLTLQLNLISHVVTALHNYLVTHTAKTGWAPLLRDVSEAESIADIAAAHDRYLRGILEKCMLLPRAAKVLEYLHRLLSAAIRFAQLLTALHDLEADNVAYTKVTQAAAADAADIAKVLEDDEDDDHRHGDIDDEDRKHLAGQLLQEARSAIRLEAARNTAAQAASAVLGKELGVTYYRFTQDLTYVNAVGERLVATRLAPYLADVLLVLDFNGYFAENHSSY